MRLESARSLVLSAQLALLGIWAVFTYLMFRLTQCAVGCAYLLLYPVRGNYFQIERRYDRFIAQKAHLAYVLATILILGAVGSIAVTRHGSDIATDNVAPIVTLAGRTLLLAVPVAYAIPWLFALAVLRRRPRSRGLERYLLSRDAHRTHFLNLAAVLVFLGALVWKLLPIIGALFAATAAWGARLSLGPLNYPRLLSLAAPEVSGGLLPRMEDLSSYLNLLQSTFIEAAAPEIVAAGMHYLFLVAAFSGLLGIGLPTLVSASRSLGYRRAVAELGLSTLKSTAVTGAMLFFVERVYLVSGAGGSVWPVLFAVLLAFMLAHDEALYANRLPNALQTHRAITDHQH